MDSLERTEKRGSVSILIVEDDAAASEVTCRIVSLQYPGAAIYTAENGRDGMELFRRHDPDIVVTDIGMPVQNGLDMAREIRLLRPEARFIVLTAYNEKGYLEEFDEIGVHAYLLKPLVLDQLLLAIASCMEEIDKAKQTGVNRRLR